MTKKRKILRRVLALIGVILTLATCTGCNSLSTYKSLVRHDEPILMPPRKIPATPPEKGVRITYFGTNSYLLQSREGSVLVDPYFSRLGPLITTKLPGAKAIPNRKRIDEGLAILPPKADLILITHAHFDHLLDTPIVAEKTQAEHVILSRTGAFQAEHAGLPAGKVIEAADGKRIEWKGIVITPYLTDHGRVGSKVPWPGTRPEEPKSTDHITDWLLGEPMGYLVEMGGKRIFINSGGKETCKLPPPSFAPVDLGIIGVPSKDCVTLFTPTVERIKPGIVIPSHQDNFGRPLSKGFKFLIFFNQASDMPGVLRQWKAMGREEKDLLLLDYYQPWTLQ